MTLEIPVHIIASYAGLAALWLVILAVQVSPCASTIALVSTPTATETSRWHSGSTPRPPNTCQRGLLTLVLELMAART